MYQQDDHLSIKTLQLLMTSDCSSWNPSMHLSQKWMHFLQFNSDFVFPYPLLMTFAACLTRVLGSPIDFLNILWWSLVGHLNKTRFLLAPTAESSSLWWPALLIATWLPFTLDEGLTELMKHMLMFNCGNESSNWRLYLYTVSRHLNPIL